MAENNEDNIDSPEFKRLFPRFPINIPVEMEVGEGGLREINYLLKIAVGGAAVKSRQKPSEGEVLLLGIPADTPSFETHAEVRWVRQAEDEYEIGLKFVEMTGESIDALHKLLQTIMPSNYKVGAPSEEDLEF